MRRLLLLSSLLSFVLLSACDPSESNPGDDMTHCDDTRCYTLSMAFECSEDGRQLYQYIDPSNTFEMEFYKPVLVAGTNYIMHDCYDDTKCMINDKGFGGCFKPCGQQKTGTVGWCNQRNGDQFYTEAKCELIDGQYVYNAVPHYSISSAIYSTDDIAHDYYCPDGRACKDDTGCVYYTAFDGQSCSRFDKASCIEEGGKTYAQVCKGVGAGEHYFVASPCDFCKLSSDMTDAYCMEKCDSEGATKLTCENYSQREWKCSTQSDGQTYWEATQAEDCKYGCDGDQCKVIPGADEDCTPSTYQGKCMDDDLFLYCEAALLPMISINKTRVGSCEEMKRYFGKDFICMSGSGRVGCGAKDYSFPCNVEGQTVKRCYQNKEPGEDQISAAFTYELVCTKLTDGSLQYIVPDGQISSYCEDLGHANACNSGGSDCE
ncbi:MAG: hypothetical protein IKY83_11840 [Proteobacteria bacterium]|nr:hypothetical protein [Pseudomonadota bacterium]